MIPTDFFTKELSNIDLNIAISQAIAENENYITDQTRTMLRSGFDAYGKSLGEYSDSYAAYKGKKAPVDLLDTGAFQNSFKAVTYDNYMEINATDSKTEKITTNYGDAILGLDVKGVQNSGEQIKGDFIDNCRKQIGL